VTRAPQRYCPRAGPPFRVGELVAFFPAEIGPTRFWLTWDDAIIEDINETAQSFSFHFVPEPGIRRGQGFENVVRTWNRALRHGWSS